MGAHVYIGLRRYARARLFLELVLGSPTQNVATPLMVEAYKKSILVNLLSTGYTTFTKGLINTQMIKTYSSLSKPYEVLADVFKKRDVLRLDAEIAAATAVWDEVCLLNSLLDENTCLTYFYRTVTLPLSIKSPSHCADTVSSTCKRLTPPFPSKESRYIST
jgi:hypothetical protein